MRRFLLATAALAMAASAAQADMKIGVLMGFTGPIESCVDAPFDASVFFGRLSACGQVLSCVDAPFDASVFFGRLSACGQVLSCVRPLNAARHTPRALMEMRGPGPYRLRELERSASANWFSRSRLD